jgi:hypothetical protein
MKALSIKSLIEFRGKTLKSKKSFATTIKTNRQEASGEGGGDYWISCLSAISRSFKLNDRQPILDRRAELEDRYENSTYERTKIMYKRNIDILYNYEDVELDQWRPAKQLTFLKRSRVDSVLTIKGLSVQVLPHYIFSFGRNEKKEIGAIWFVAKLGGLKKEELGMFADVLYRYLKSHFSKEYNLSEKYCIAVDVNKNYQLSYKQIEIDQVPLILNSTLDEVKSFM